MHATTYGIMMLFALSASACVAPGAEPASTVSALIETVAVASADDAADDPAIWINRAAPDESLILGTDKQAGLYVYRLDGSVAQFLPVGRLNNVDLRQNVRIGDANVDVAAASNRSDDTIVLFSIADGRLTETGRFPSDLPEPYGLCTGVVDEAFTVFVAHKTGDLIAYPVRTRSDATSAARLKLDTQLEGCVYNETSATLFIGEEARGVWKATYKDGRFGTPTLVDVVGRANGLVADVEGLAIHRGADGDYLIASSQGDNAFVIYDLASLAPLAKFRIGAHGSIDGVQETDGIDATGVALGDAFPNGVLVVQDGKNLPGGDNQNFKFIDWRAIASKIGAGGPFEKPL